MVCHPSVIKKEVNGSLQCENRAWNERRSLAKEVLTELQRKRAHSPESGFTARTGWLRPPSRQHGHFAKAFIKHFSHQLQCPRNNVEGRPSFILITPNSFAVGGKWCLAILVPPPPNRPLPISPPIHFACFCFGSQRRMLVYQRS